MILATLLFLQAAANAGADAWDFKETTEGLTGSKTISALLRAKEPVSNMLGDPEYPAFMLRCREGQMALYVTWPQVLSTQFVADKTVVQSRIDQQRIKTDLWDVSSDGTATGVFSTRKAINIASGLLHAKEFALRLTGSSTQDAVFDLSGFDAAIARVSAVCGATLREPKPK